MVAKAGVTAQALDPETSECHDALVDRKDSTMSHEEPPGHRRPPSVDDVGALVARSQHLVDSRPGGSYPLAWCIKASYIGDLTALAMIAARAAGVTRPTPPVC